MRKLILLSLVLSFFATASTCRRRNSDAVTVALPEKFQTFDTVTTMSSDAAAERVKNLMFNSLVKKDEKFEYIGELAKEIKTSEDGKVITFVLQDNVKFHNGQDFTSADVKYTFEQLFASNGYKAGAFFDSVPDDSAPATKPAAAPATSPAAAKPAEEKKMKRIAHISSIETPDAKTVVFTVARPALRNQLLSNLVAVPIIATGSAPRQKDAPIGTGPFKFVSLDAAQSIVELAANQEYWEGVPKVAKLRLKTITDANSLQAELSTGGVDIAPNPNNISPDTLKSLASNASLKVEQSDGSNIQYLVFNTQSAPLNNVKVRQAIGYAINREKIVSELLFDQAKVADSILPPNSWAYSQGTKYSYDPAKAKQLLQEAGYKGEPIVFKFGSGLQAVSQYSQVLQSAMNDVGLNVQIETFEVNTIRTHLAQGNFQMYTGVWIGGNQDPIFLRDLFSSTKIPGGTVSCCNRSRYTNAELDKAVLDAENSTDKAKAKELYGKAWTIASEELPLLPLWYPANIIVANKRIGDIKINASGDWSFLKNITSQ
ncbi:ABC transporter substrate-binding protein [uncultured Sphingorhabdus sp.]|uniref:ABC transporter substrate-binding protein n=1 Tax=uncultured Sphingorhabdus sp. TaxID=1686106 RepID=UPI00261A9E11|nr:ABC transporter substrate-binding protein [uncultured Sphingorhabdus sp.]HMS18997.1 ABC transporter substrate-binding protein [Sphingorhabdus sp.]